MGEAYFIPFFLSLIPLYSILHIQNITDVIKKKFDVIWWISD